MGAFWFVRTRVQLASLRTLVELARLTPTRFFDSKHTKKADITFQLGGELLIRILTGLVSTIGATVGT